MSVYSYCPDCGRKKVRFAARPMAEDNYYCTRASCNFYFFTCSDSSLDNGQRARWEAKNELKTNKRSKTCDTIA